MKSLGGRGRWAVQYVTLVPKCAYENGNSSSFVHRQDPEVCQLVRRDPY